MEEQSLCFLCPRKCGVKRSHNKLGYCRMSDQIKAARAALHLWEEPCICSMAGSGTVFFSGCTLQCVYCQNKEIALGTTGKLITIQRLSKLFLELQEKGACNINLVTPTHFIPQIKEALLISKSNGLLLPIIYNTSGYETVEGLRLLDGLIDVYLPDLKYKSSELSARYSNAPDYFEAASKAIAEMYRQTGSISLKDDSLTRGVLVRHLILPGCTRDSKEILQYLYENYGNHILISILNQYTPMDGLIAYPELTRKITNREYNRVLDFALDLGIECGFFQSGETAKESFIPAFDLEGL